MGLGTDDGDEYFCSLKYTVLCMGVGRYDSLVRQMNNNECGRSKVGGWEANYLQRGGLGERCKLPQKLFNYIMLFEVMKKAVFSWRAHQTG